MLTRKTKSKFTRYKKKLPNNRAITAIVRRQLDRAIEDKISYHSFEDENVTQVWTEYNVCTPALGADSGQRIGRRIRIKSLEIRIAVIQGSNELLTDDAFNLVRFIVALYNSKVNTPLATNGVTMSTPLLRTTTVGGSCLIKKYLDQYFTLNVSSTEQGDGDGYTPQIKLFKYYKKFKNLYIDYGSGNNIDFDKQLHFSFLSDSIAATHPYIYKGWWVCRYEDA